MKHRLLGVLVVLLVLSADGLLACGEKFLVAGRGTRYHRPKNARAASVLIYANPSWEVEAGIDSSRLESMLKHQGHRSTTVRTSEQLSNVISSGRFDVVLTASAAAATIEQLLAGAADAAVVLAIDGTPKAAMLLKAIDNAVAQRDLSLQRSRTLP